MISQLNSDNQHSDNDANKMKITNNGKTTASNLLQQRKSKITGRVFDSD